MGAALAPIFNPRGKRVELKTVILKLTGTIAVDGVILRAGHLVELVEKDAKALLARGKAVLHEAEADVSKVFKRKAPAAAAAPAPAAPAAPVANGASAGTPAPAAAGGEPDENAGA
jgi:hypothetical protein